MNEDERNKLREIFKDSVIGILDDYDPAGMIANQIKADTGIGYGNYVNNKTEEFINKLEDKRLI